MPRSSACSSSVPGRSGRFASNHDCCLEPVLDLGEALESELVRAREMVVEVEQPGADGVRLLGVPVLSRTPGAPAGPGPALGEHTDEVLGALGYSPEEIGPSSRAARWPGPRAGSAPAASWREPRGQGTPEAAGGPPTGATATSSRSSGSSAGPRLPVASCRSTALAGRWMRDARLPALREAARASGGDPREAAPYGRPARTHPIRSARGDGPAATAGRGPQARARGRAPALAGYCPSTSGHGGAEASWLARDCLIEHEVELRASFRRPVQTNEPGRARALVGGFLSRSRPRPACRCACSSLARARV